MGRLSDILNGSGDYFKDWNDVKAAGDDGPIPRGQYICHLTKGELRNSRTKGTPGIVLEFTVIEGDCKGRKVWHDLWFTDLAKPRTKRDLDRLGITDPERQLDHPMPRWIRCNVTVVVHRDDDGTERNKVQSFEVIGRDEPEVNAFAPLPAPSVDPTGGADVSFDVPF